MKRPLLLAVDLGGTNLRATAFDTVGERVAASVAATPHEPDAPPLGRRYDPEQVWRAACQAIGEVVKAASAGDGEIVAVAATGQRLACAFIDADGATLYLGPNTDARGVMYGWQVEEASAGALYERTGRGMPLLFAPSRLLWLVDNQPEIAARVERVIGLGDWMAQRLCGEAAIDLCGAVELLVADVYTGDYWPQLWSTLGLDAAWVPRPSQPGETAGRLSAATATATGLRQGIPVAVCPPDSMAAILGSGSAAPGWTVILAGSTMPVLASALSPVADPARRTWTGRHPVAGRGVNESNGGTTGFGWAWVVEKLIGDVAGLEPAAAYQHAERLVAATPPGAHDALAFTGGASVMNATRPVALLNRLRSLFWPPAYVNPAVTGGDAVRAALEAVAYSARANLEQAESARGSDHGPVVLSEGMSQSAQFTQMVADVINRPIHRPRLAESTSVGAAMCAAVAAGVYTSVDVAAAAMTMTSVAAEPDPAAVGAYSQAYHEWRLLYEKMEAL
ncbi:MAG TPA: FGGY-family carbohydrate kinase [Candidatus Dormibacteraeota bacterium]|nr:FGGY-family carbohydrate kinase [Candidatus Dormibacteraeota bacterium]